MAKSGETGTTPSQPLSSTVLLPPDAKCIGCGYAVVQLEETRCPECGRAFDPADPSSFDYPGRRRRAWARWLESQRAWQESEQILPLSVWFLVFVGAFVTEVVLLNETWSLDVVVLFWACPPLALAWLARWRLRRWVLKSAPDRYARSERVFNYGYGLLCVVLIILSSHCGQTCPHGSRYGIGPVGWGSSTIGSPCNSPGIRYWNVSERSYVWYAAGG